MSFSISLQLNTSPANSLNKTRSTVYTFTGTLKEGTSIQDPVVLVEHNGAITGVNYAEIATFGRKYFIRDIKNVNNKLWEISLHSDPLTSFAPQIRSCVGIIGKNQHDFNLYLNDGTFKVYQDSYVIQRAFPNAFDYSNFSYVIAITAGKEAV